MVVNNNAHLALYISLCRITLEFQEIWHVIVCSGCGHYLHPIQPASSDYQKHDFFSCAAFLLTIFSIFIIFKVLSCGVTHELFSLYLVPAGFFAVSEVRHLQMFVELRLYIVNSSIQGLFLIRFVIKA